MKKITILLGTLLLIFGFSTQSWCLTYSATDILNNTTPGATVTEGTTLSLKTTPSLLYTGVGTADGVAGEIDASGVGVGANEWIRITFNTPQTLNDIKVAFLYPGLLGGYGDVVNEETAFITNLGTYNLQATGTTLATWNGSGVVTNLEVAQAPGGGVWDISNPFASPISYIEFRAVHLPTGDGSTDSDYSIVSVSTSSVPEPTTMLLLGLGLIGLAGVRRKSK